MYQADVTQALTPSAPDPSTGVRAAALQGSVFEGVVGAIGQAYEMKKRGDLRAIEEEAASLPREALQREQDVFNEAQQLAQLEGAKAKERTIFEENTSTDAGAGAAMQEGAKAKIVGFISRAERLKEASKGYMSAAEYTSRVASLTKEAIAKYPGLSKEIRQSIARATGMEHADDTAAMSYVRRMFSDKKEKDNKLLQDDIKTISTELGVMQEDVAATVGTPAYEAYKAAAVEQLRVRRQTEWAQAQSNRIVATNAAAIQERARLQSSVAVGRSVYQMGQYLSSPTIVPIMQAIEKAVAPGPDGLIDMTKVQGAKTQLDMVGGQLTSLVNKNFSAVEQDLLQERMAGRLSADGYKEQKIILDEVKKQALAPFAPTSMQETASILVAHKDKALGERIQLLSTYTKLLETMGDKDLVQTWFGSSDGSDARKNIERLRPELANVLKSVSGPLSEAGNSITSLVGTGGVAAVSYAVQDGKVSPTATPALPGQKPADVRAALQGVAATADMKWRAIAKDPALASVENLNYVSTALNNGMKYSQAVTMLRGGIADEKRVLASIPEALLTPAKEATAAQYSETSRAIVDNTEILNKKYSTKLRIGVSNGAVGIVPPTELFTTVDKLGGALPTPIDPMFSYSTTKNMVVAPGKEEAYRSYVQAAKEWQQKYYLSANNLVLTRSLLSEQDSKDVANDVAFNLAAGKPLPPFFTSAPAPATGVPLGSEVVPVKNFKTEKNLTEAMKSGAADLADEVARLKAMLPDLLPESPTYKRISSSIKEAEAELARMK